MKHIKWEDIKLNERNYKRNFDGIDRTFAEPMLPKLRKPPMTSDDILKVLVWAAANNVRHITYDTMQGINVEFFQAPQASADAPEVRQRELAVYKEAASKAMQQEHTPQEEKRETDIDVVMNPGRDILFPPDNEPSKS